MDSGKTRPEEPVNTSWPSAREKSCTSSGPKLRSMGASGAEGCILCRNASVSSAIVRLRPDLPAIRNLRPKDGLLSATVTARPPSASASAAINPAGPDPITNASAMVSSMP